MDQETAYGEMRRINFKNFELLILRKGLFQLVNLNGSICKTILNDWINWIQT